MIPMPFPFERVSEGDGTNNPTKTFATVHFCFALLSSSVEIVKARLDQVGIQR